MKFVTSALIVIGLIACSEGNFTDNAMGKKSKRASASAAGGDDLIGAGDGGGNGRGIDGGSGGSGGNGGNGMDGSGSDGWSSDGAGGGSGGNGGTGGSGGTNGDGDGSRDTQPGTGGSPTGGNGGGDNGQGQLPPEVEIFKDPKVPAPQACFAQKILIVDLKSGWWDFHGEGMLDLVRQALQSACPGQKSTFDYFHGYIGDGHAKYYKDKDFNYTQVWIFSGSTDDAEDIYLDDSRLKDLIKRISEKKPKLLLTGGIGAVEHVNKVAKDAIGVSVFAKNNKYIDPDFRPASTKVLSRTTGHPVNSSLFTGLQNGLPDRMKIDNRFAQLAADRINDNAGIIHLAQCAQKDGGASYPCLSIGEINGFKLILDSGWQRTYAVGIASDAADLKAYLTNIVRTLSL